MKRLLVTALVTLALGSSAVMADHDGMGMGGSRGDRGPMALQSQLNLTDAQKEQLKTMHEEQKKQMQAAMTATRDRIAQLLTADQATKFKAMTDKMDQRRAEHEKRMAEGDKGDGKGRGEWGGRGHGGRGEGGRGHGGGKGFGGHGLGGKGGFGSAAMVDRLKQELSLTPEQVTQVETIVKDQQAQMDQFRKASKDRLVQMLTPEQATKFQTLENERKQRMQQHIQDMQQRLERM